MHPFNVPVRSYLTSLYGLVLFAISSDAPVTFSTLYAHLSIQEERGSYDNADVFSFGILLCELITCLVNDGLRIPRTPVFGLDVDSLPTPPDCPSWLLDLAVRCCNVEHTCRPLVKEINQILRYHLANWCGGMNSSQSTPKTAIVEDPTLELDVSGLKYAGYLCLVSTDLIIFVWVSHANYLLHSSCLCMFGHHNR
ncbi:unnamed protein product [Dibothriocephalus latus]|uniref:Serine-threonine/tyrosine-protein kinase catalytic domain-containing protein n=1 Tax=Dibothriocephalus latus TaxID=60516 RepID=A0A3P7QHQ1_DIBLA|nr:unnamed protein product [Dibothriocephalus latus]